MEAVVPYSKTAVEVPAVPSIQLQQVSSIQESLFPIRL